MIGVGDWRCSELERTLVNKVLDSGRLSYGPMSRELEQRFAAEHDCDYGVLSNSGTSSLQVALQAMKELEGWPDGTKVAVPAVTFVATVNIVLHNRMVPVLVDVDPATYNMDVAKLAKVIEEDEQGEIACVIPVHLFGQPADMAGIMEIAGKYDLRVIEDSCECMFAEHAGVPVGAWGDIACFSFYVAHLLTTGVGGIAITNEPDYAAKMRSLVNHGRDGIYIGPDDSASASGEELREIISRRFRFESIGHSFRLTELEAALGLGQLETWPDMIAARQRNAQLLSELLDPLAGSHLQLPWTHPLNTHSFMMYPILMLGGDKEAMVNHLENAGIETRDMLPLIRQPVYDGFWEPGDYPVAEAIDRHGFYVGCHQNLTAEDIQAIARAIYSFYEAKSMTEKAPARKEIRSLIRKFDLEDGHVILLKHGTDIASPAYMQAMIRHLQNMGFPRVILAVVKDFDDLEVLSEQEMAKHGWVRAPSDDEG